MRKASISTLSPLPPTPARLPGCSHRQLHCGAAGVEPEARGGQGAAAQVGGRLRGGGLCGPRLRARRPWMILTSSFHLAQGPAEPAHAVPSAPSGPNFPPPARRPCALPLPPCRAMRELAAVSKVMEPGIPLPQVRPLHSLPARLAAWLPSPTCMHACMRAGRLSTQCGSGSACQWLLCKAGDMPSPCGPLLAYSM